MAAPDEDKRRRIVEAATTLFSRYGFKRTSVDLLAHEAGVAKPTVYAYFKDKDAVFCAVVEAVCAGFLEAATKASKSRAPIEERLVLMLAAKFTRYWELVHASPHAQELMGSQGRLGAAIVERCDRAYLELLTSVIAGAKKELAVERVGLTAQAAALVLVRAASGAAFDATTAAEHKRHLAEIVRVIVAAMRK